MRGSSGETRCRQQSTPAMKSTSKTLMMTPTITNTKITSRKLAKLVLCFGKLYQKSDAHCYHSQPIDSQLLMLMLIVIHA